MRFILDDCCARAASGHVAAAPSAVMKSRRRMYPPEGKPLRRLKPNTLRGAEGEKGQQIDPKRCDPMSANGVNFGLWRVQLRGPLYLGEQTIAHAPSVIFFCVPLSKKLPVYISEIRGARDIPRLQ